MGHYIVLWNSGHYWRVEGDNAKDACDIATEIRKNEIARGIVTEEIFDFVDGAIEDTRKGKH